MAAFAPSTFPRALRNAQCRDRSQCSTRPRACAVAGNGAPPSADEEYVQRALDNSASLRAELEATATQRKESARRTEESIAKMSAALDVIMEKIRIETGEAAPPAPPIATTSKAVETADAATPPPAAASVAEDDGVEPYMDPSTFGMDSTAGWQVLANSDALPTNGAGSDVKFRIECDQSGCSIIEMDADAAPGPGVRQKFVHCGRGFRVGFDPEAPDSFCGLVGNEQWLLAMGRQEIQHFKRLCLALRKKMGRIESGEEDPPVKKPAVRRSGDGMFNERVGRTGADCSVELESKLMWVQAFGKPKLGQFGIRAIFMEGRQSEGYWAPDVVPNMLAAVAKLDVE